MALAPCLVLALFLLAFFSPVAAVRIARLFEAVARELRHHAAGMDGAYACYGAVRRSLGRTGARLEAVAASAGPERTV